MCGEGEEVGCRRGKIRSFGSFHVTLLWAYSYVRLLDGTLVPGDCVSTHPRDEGVGRRDRCFIGMSEGFSEGTNEGGGLSVVRCLSNDGVGVGRETGRCSS